MDESVEDRLERLRAWFTSIEASTSRLSKDLKDHKEETKAAIKQLTQTHEASARELRALIKEMESKDARINGRAVPVIGWGILLSGIPEALAKYPPLGWIAFGVGVVAASVVLRSIFKDYLRHRQAGNAT